MTTENIEEGTSGGSALTVGLGWQPFKYAPIGYANYKGKIAIFWNKTQGGKQGWRVSKCEADTIDRKAMRPTLFKWVELPNAIELTGALLPRPT